MNPAFSGDPNRPEFQPGTTNFMSLAGGGDPGVSGGDPTQLAATRAQREAERQARGTAHRATLAQRPGAPTPPGPGGGAGPRPTPTGLDRYYGGGNVGNSLAGAIGNFRYNPVPVDNAGDYPWMQDQSIQWGGGPHGYLPIDYQPQAFDYYAQGNYGSHLAPWEYKYWKDTWTQNYDNQAPGFVNTQRGSRDPDYYGNLRG